MNERLGNSPELETESVDLLLHPNIFNKCVMLGLLDDTSVGDQLRTAITIYTDDLLGSDVRTLIVEDPADVLRPARQSGVNIKLTVPSYGRAMLSEIIETHGLSESEHVGRAVGHYFRTRANDPTLASQIAAARTTLREAHQDS